MRAMKNYFLRVETAFWLIPLMLLLIWPSLLNNLFNSNYMSHVHCYLRTESLIWLHLLSDASIGFAYVAISVSLVYLVVRAKSEIPFSKMFLAFGLFIISCGATHFMEVMTLWNPVYWLSGGVKLVTAVASVTTAIALPFFIPKILKLISEVRLSQGRHLMLEHFNAELEKQIYEKKEIEMELRKSHEELDYRVKTRTAELEEANKNLREEIKKHEATQKVLRETEARLSGIVQSAMDAIITIDVNQNVLLFNTAAEKMFLYNADEAIGFPISRLIPERFNKAHMQHIQKFGKAGVTNRRMGALGAVSGIRKSGEEFPIEASISQVETFGQKLYTVILRDITDRKHSEQALRESEARFRMMADTAPVLIWMTDLNGQINYLNRVWLAFTGRTLEDEIKLGKSGGIHPEDFNESLEIYSSAFNAKEKFQVEYRLKRHDGIYRWILDTGVPRFTEDGTFIGYIGSCIDITERKQIEEQINDSLKEKGILLKEIHHRVKNNLQIISSLLSLQSNYVKDQNTLEPFKESQNRIKSMALIHEKLYQTGDLSHVNIKEYVTDLVSGLYSTYRDKSKNINFSINITELLINMDLAISLGLILNELISNALKYAFPNKPEGEINVIFQPDGNNNYILIVSDNGIGLPENFEFPGTETLGFQLVKSLVNQHDAEIEFNKNGGTEIKITFLQGNVES